MNTCNLLKILLYDNGTWEILESLIMVLLGKKHDGSDGLLVKALHFKAQDLKKNLFGFERYFVLTVAVYGNLAPFLHSDTKSLFQETFRALENPSSDSSSNEVQKTAKRFKLSKATSLIELFNVINTIQTKYSRGMVTYDFTNSSFKLVQPTEFPQTKIGFTEKCKVSFKRNIAKDPEKASNKAQESESDAKFSEEDFPLLAKKGSERDLDLEEHLQRKETGQEALMQEKDFSTLTKLGEDTAAVLEEPFKKQETGQEALMQEKDFPTLTMQEGDNDTGLEEPLQKQETGQEVTQKSDFIKKQDALSRQHETSLQEQEIALDHTNFSMREESHSISQQSKRDMHERSSDVEIGTEDPPPDDLKLAAINQTKEAVANLRAQESMKKQDIQEKNKEKLIARVKEFRFQPGYKLSTEEKRFLDPSQEKIKAIKLQWGKKDT